MDSMKDLSAALPDPAAKGKDWNPKDDGGKNTTAVMEYIRKHYQPFVALCALREKV